MQMIGQNPMAQQMMAALQAHIAEHVGFKYRNQIQEQLGMALPPPDEDMPEQLEVQVSRLVAAASQQVLLASQKQAQAIQTMQQMQDPVVQMQQAEMQIKAQEAQTKAQKVALDAQAKERELALREKEAMLRIALDEQELELKQMTENAKLGAALIKDTKKGETPK